MIKTVFPLLSERVRIKFKFVLRIRKASAALEWSSFLIRKDLLDRKLDSETQSYWLDKIQEDNKDRYLNQF